ncbi:hypothetical protein C8R43DRAFT_1123892 [Mycena crocata]|nr:hypothetical protein C8R43DRAFT_1123892 [Mycena crocata]
MSFGSSPSRAGRNPDTSIFYETPTQDLRSDRAIYVSADGRRATTTAVNVTYRKKARNVAPEDLSNDPFSRWTPVPERGTPADDNGYGAGKDMPGDVPGGEYDTQAERVHILTASGGKRKRTVPTNLRWRPLAQKFLDEQLRAEGLGDAMSDPRCGYCLKEHPASMFRCADCGMYMQCEECVIKKHTLEPLHRLKRWNGKFWQGVNLKSLNIIYQLGHGGLPCPNPDTKDRTVVVIHTNGIHTLDYHQCGCDLSDRSNNLRQFQRNAWYPATTVDPATCATYAVLDLFRLLNVVGNMSVHDFVGTLERLTDATRVRPVPDRYKAFGHMWRQYAFLDRAKRAGCGHNPDGLESTANGGMAEPCWTCPQEDKNIPTDWRNVAPEFKFLYMIILAMDANFRLKNRIRENEVHDPSFGSGWGYFVQSGPYKEHLKDYVAEKDITTCIAFAALMQKDTRQTTGLRCSGIGGVVCARHEVVRVQGMGDLQKGERYANMDYIFWCSIIGLTLMILVSYDIACQWKINLMTRKLKMPDTIKPLAELEIEYALPVWHAAAHERDCQAQNSLAYTEGAARTDGEGIERTWSGLNPAAWSTKEMGEGARHDALEDRIDHHNWEKNISQGSTLARRLVVAIEERDIQIEAFDEVNRTLSDELRVNWQGLVDAWIKDKKKANPYVVPNAARRGPTEAQVRLELKRDELNESNEARDVRQRGATAFLIAGLQLEELQARIKGEMKGRALLVADQDGVIAELRLSFEEKLKLFRELQGRHMPGVASILEDEEDRRDSERPPPKPEVTKLWMPSELTTMVRTRACAKGLGDREVKLREVQADNALDKVRLRLFAKHHLLLHNNGVGQRYATRANTLLSQVQEKIEASADKYRRARDALLALKGLEYCATKFHELRPADLVLEEEREKDATARHKLAMIGSTRGRHRNAPAVESEKKKKKGKKKPAPVMSWIWTVAGGPEEDEVALHASVRVEWSKALARKRRWTEEVTLLREEMKRVLRFLRWKAGWWEEQRGRRAGTIAAEILAGLDAYASRQAASCRSIARRFRAGWEASKSEVVKRVLAEDAEFMESIATFTAATDPDSEEQPDPEQENDGEEMED